MQHSLFYMTCGLSLPLLNKACFKESERAVTAFDEQKKVDELRDIFSELQDADDSSAKLVAEAIEYVQGKGYLTEFGAFTDVLAPEGRDEEARRKAQVLAATLPESGVIDSGRRQVIRSILGWGATLVSGAAGGVIAGMATNELYKSETYEESFIREILRLHSNRPALWEWRDKLRNNGRTNEAELISAVAVHGEGFGDAHDAINRLRELIDAADIGEFARAYLEFNYATHHRYLGLTHQAFKLQGTFIGFSTNDARLNVLLLNHRHMNRHLILDDFTALVSELIIDNNKLSNGMIEKIGIDPASMETVNFQEARDISVECVALKGLYLMNNCIASRTESEALNALDLIDQYRRKLVATLINPEIASGREWMAIRLYGEAVWNYTRVAPVALVRGWDRVLDRCLDAFYNLDSTVTSVERTVMASYHRTEASELRSPLWIQMAIIRAIRDQILSGTGAQSLSNLIPYGQQFKIRHHSGLQRSLDAMTVALGGNATAINELNTFVSVENRLMLECVREMLRRTSHKNPQVR